MLQEVFVKPQYIAEDTLYQLTLKFQLHHWERRDTWFSRNEAFSFFAASKSDLLSVGCLLRSEIGCSCVILLLRRCLDENDCFCCSNYRMNTFGAMVSCLLWWYYLCKDNSIAATTFLVDATMHCWGLILDGNDVRITAMMWLLLERF